MINLHERMLPTSAGLNPRPPGLQSDGASNWATEAGSLSDKSNVEDYSKRNEFARWGGGGVHFFRRKALSLQDTVISLNLSESKWKYPPLFAEKNKKIIYHYLSLG